MGVHILHDRDGDRACFFCSTTDWAFGPVFGDGEHGDANDRAEAFQRWIETTETWHEYETALGSAVSRDARLLTDRGLERAYGDWLAQEAHQVAREHEAEMAE